MERRADRYEWFIPLLSGSDLVPPMVKQAYYKKQAVLLKVGVPWFSGSVGCCPDGPGWGSFPSQGTYRNQPVGAWVDGTADFCLSLSLLIYLNNKGEKKYLNK